MEDVGTSVYVCRFVPGHGEGNRRRVYYGENKTGSHNGQMKGPVWERVVDIPFNVGSVQEVSTPPAHATLC